MSKQIIEERLIKLGIDNEQFKNGLKESLSSLDSLDKALEKSDGKNPFGNTEKATKSLSNSLTDLIGSAPKLGNAYVGVFDKIGSALGNTAGGFKNFASSALNFISPISLGSKQAAEAISSIDDHVGQTSGKFGMLQSIATVALGNIAASAIQTGLSITMNLGRSILNTIAPMKAGFGQFEDKINSVNMLVAALGRSELGNITESLDDLQHYAETTKYSVKQMHSSLAQFVNAGVGLKDANTALKGWGNLAASAGATTDGFNRSLQFGVQQALQMGKMNTQNWVSVENAGLATQKFKDILVQTAQALGQDVDMSEGFRNSLQQGWLTNEVLIQSLKTLAEDETLVKMASEFHTLGEVSEAVADQVTSSWARFWETLIGQAGSEEVTQFWTKWGNIAADTLGAVGNKATEFAQAFVDLGGRQKMLELLETSFQSLGTILKPIGTAFTHVFGFSTTNTVAEKLVNLVSTFIEKIKLGSAELKAFENIFIFVFQGIKWVSIEVASKLKLLGTLIPDHMIKNFIIIVGMLATAVTRVIRSIEIILSKFIDFKKLGEIFQSVSDKIKKFWDAVHNGLSGFAEKWNAAFYKLPEGIGKFIDWLKKFWEVIKRLTPAIGEFKQSMRELFSKITNPFSALNDALGKNGRGFNEWAFWVGNALKRFPVFGNALGKFMVGFSHFNDATYNMDSAAGRLGDKLRRNLNKTVKYWKDSFDVLSFNHKVFWKQFNSNMDKVLKGEIRTWKDFNKNLNWDTLVPKEIGGLFSGIKFKLPKFDDIKKGFGEFFKNPFGNLAKGTGDLSKWLEKSEFSFKSFGDTIRKKWPTLSEYADKLDKIKFSLSFLKPVVDAVGKAFEWLTNKLSGLGLGKLDFGSIGKTFSDAGKALNANFSEGIVPGIVKSIDGLRKWVAELGVTKAAMKTFSLGTGIVSETFSNIKKEMGKSKADFSNYKTTLKTFGNWFSGFWKGIGDTASGPSMSRVFEGFKKAFGSVIEWFQSTFGPWFKKFFDGLPEGVQKNLISMWDAVKKFTSDFLSNFKGADLSFKDFGKTVSDIGKGIGKVFEDLGKALKKVWDGFKDLFKVSKVYADEVGDGDYGQSGMKKAEQGLNDLGESVDRVHNKTQNIFTTIGDTAKLIGDIFKSMFEPLGKQDSETLGRVTALVGAIILLWNTRKKVIGIKEMFGDFGKNLLQGPKTFLGSLTGMFGTINKYFKSKARFENIKAFALAIATLAGSLWLLSTIPGDKLLTGLGGLVGVLVIFEVFYLTLSKTTKNFNPAKIRNMQQAMIGMMGLAGSILILASSVAILGNLDLGQLAKGVGAVSIMLLAIFGSMAIMNKLQGKTVRGTQKIAVSILTFVGIAYAIKKIVPAIKELGSMDLGSLTKGITAMLGIVLGMSLLLTKVSDLKGTKLSSFLVFTFMAKSMKTMAETVGELGKLDTGALIKGGLAVGGLIAVMSLMINQFSKLDKTNQSFTKNAVVLFGGLAIIFKMVTELASTMSDMKNPEGVANAIGSITLMVASFAGLAAILGNSKLGDAGINEGVKNLAIISASLVVAAGSMFVLSKMDGNFLSVLGSATLMVTTVGAFITLGKLAGKLNKEAFIKLGATVGLVAAATLSLKVLSTISTDNLLGQVLALVAVVGALATIGTLMSKFGGAGAAGAVTALATAFLAIGAGIGVAAAGIGYFVDSCARLVSSINDLINTMARLGAEGGRNFAAFLKEAAKGSEDLGTLMARAAAGIIEGLLNGIQNNLGKIGSIGIEIIKGILHGLEQTASMLVDTLINIVETAFFGVIDKIPTWILRLCDSLLAGIQQIAQWLRNNKNIIMAAVLEVLISIQEVVVEVIKGIIDLVLNILSNIPFVGDFFKGFRDSVNGLFDDYVGMLRKSVEETKTYASLATTDGIKSAIDVLDKLGPEEAAAAQRFAGKAKDGLEYLRIYCSQLGIEAPEQFINGLKNHTISANEAGKLLAKMVELGMSETQANKIAEEAGYTYANGVLTAKEQAKASGDQLKQAVEQGLTGDGNGFDTGLITAAFEKLNTQFGGQLDVTKALAGVKSGEINQEMLSKFAEGDFSGVSEENMNEYLKPIEGMGEKAAASIDGANQQVGASMDTMNTDVSAKAAETAKSLTTALTDFTGAVLGAQKGTGEYSAEIGKGKTPAETAAKEVAKGTKESLKFSATGEANDSVKTFTDTVQSGENKGKAEGAGKQVNSAAKRGLKGTGGAASSGEAITLAFAGGLASSAALAAIDGAMARVNSRVKHHQPHSPAKRGVFSGAGWTGVFKSGLAIAKEFASGLGSTKSLNAISNNMDRVNSFVQQSIDTISGYLDDNIEMRPVITPVLDMSNIEGYRWNGAGTLTLSPAGVDYNSLNPNTRNIRDNRSSIDDVVRNLESVDKKLNAITENTEIGNNLLAQDRINVTYMDKDLVTRALAPGITEAQRTLTDRQNMLDGVLPQL